VASGSPVKERKKERKKEWEGKEERKKERKKQTLGGNLQRKSIK
jgi:hypothetical protein